MYVSGRQVGDVEGKEGRCGVKGRWKRRQEDGRGEKMQQEKRRNDAADEEGRCRREGKSQQQRMMCRGWEKENGKEDAKSRDRKEP